MRRLWLRSWRSDDDSVDVAAYLRSECVLPGGPLLATPSALDPGLYTEVLDDDGVRERVMGTSTGLGLPLSRALAKVSRGWIGLVDSHHLTPQYATEAETTMTTRSHARGTSGTTDSEASSGGGRRMSQTKARTMSQWSMPVMPWLPRCAARGSA